MTRTFTAPAVLVAALFSAAIISCTNSTTDSSGSNASQVTVNPDSVTLTGVGATATLSANVIGRLGPITNPTLTWTSSNTTVADVQATGTSARVTSKAPGVATITATSGSVSGSAIVVVRADVVTSVALTPTSASLSTIGATTTITAAVVATSGPLANPTVTWSSNNTNVATVAGTSSAGVVTARGFGSATISATSGGITATATVTVAAPAVVTQWTPSRVPVVGGPVTGFVNGLWGTSAANVYAATSDGDILRYDGIRWSLQQSNGGYFRGLSGSAATDIFAVADAGVIWHSTNGSTWAKMTSPTTQDFRAVSSVTSTSAFAVGLNGTILSYNGSAWSTMASGTTQHLFGVWAVSSTNVWAVGASGTLLHYTGTTWASVASGTTQTLYALWGSAANNIYAVGANGTILHYDGVNWIAQASGVTFALFAVSGSGTTDVWAVGDCGTTLHYTGTWVASTAISCDPDYSAWTAAAGGVLVGGLRGWIVLRASGTATPTTISLSPNYLGVALTGPTTAFIVGEFSTILRWDGANYVPIGTPTIGFYNDVSASGASTAFAVGNLNARFDGTNWTSVAFPSGVTQFNGVWVLNAANIFAVGSSGRVYRYDGSAWLQLATGVATNLTGIWGTSPTNLFVVGDGGSILQYNGTGWMPMTSPTTQNLRRIWGTSASDIFAVGSNGTIIHYNGTAWSTMTSGATASLQAVWGSSSSDVYVVGLGGVILRYNGAVWSPMTSGTTQDLFGVSGISGGGGFAVGASSTVIRGTSSGAAALLPLISPMFERAELGRPAKGVLSATTPRR